ncbi:MAG: hypothetical protein Q7R71_02245 [bacterium]|nr:hypothetical protein [bacterium]
MGEKLYTEHPDRAVEDPRFSHMMAIALDPSTENRRGVIRCITSREGDVEVKGYIDRSKLFTVSGDSLEHFSVGEELQIKNTNEIVGQLRVEGLDFLGLEDPDIWRDENTRLIHLYFTMPFISRNKPDEESLIHLGHAVGRDLDSLEMTMPVLQASQVNYKSAGAKEVSIAPINSKGFRFNLFEGHNKLHEDDEDVYSTVRIAVAKDMGEEWDFGETVFHPGKAHIPWIGGHSSPGPLFSKNFIDIGKEKLLGVINGREANKHVDGKTIYGMFSVGLFIYDYENGKIDWVSPEPLIQDSEAKTITFASQFVETGKGEGILYAHVDDSFVRAYTLKVEDLKSLLPNNT